jgi:hypothetical protein
MFTHSGVVRHRFETCRPRSIRASVLVTVNASLSASKDVASFSLHQQRALGQIQRSSRDDLLEWSAKERTKGSMDGNERPSSSD